MAVESIFRFMALRPANLKKKQDAVDKRIDLYPDATMQSKLYQSIETAWAQGASKREIVAIAEGFQATNAYVKDMRKLEFNVSLLRNWIVAHSDQPLEDANLAGNLKKIYGQPPGEIIQKESFKKAFLALADSLLADAIAPPPGERHRDDLSVAFKLMEIVRRLGHGEALASVNRLGELLSRTALALPEITDLSRAPADKSPEKQDEQPTKAIDENAVEIAALKARLAELGKAHSELSRLATDENAIIQPRQEEDRIAPRIVSLEQRVSELARLCGAAELKPTEGEPQVARVPVESARILAGLGRGQILLSTEAVSGLSETTQAVLRSFKLDPKRINPLRTVSLIEEEMGAINARLASEQTHTTLLKLGGAYLEINKFKASLGMFGALVGMMEWVLRQCGFKVGIGDLLMVKQKLKAYELAEFAHVENVLAGESREREHRRLNVREEIITVEEERETEKERDLQSTERSELQNEAEKTVKSQVELEAGLQVSGSYGPCISFSSSLNAGFSTTTEETQRKSTSYSREVTEKSAERIRERVREERRRRVLEEIEEINRHKVDNSNAANGHVRGIYRWLNKIYDAQVFNYGQRMMYEFVIPEPAAYFLYALVENPPTDMELIKPEPPTYLGMPLKPSNLSRTNYNDYVSKYQVTNAPEPPSEFQVVSHFDKQDGKEENNFGRSAKLTIPAGYEAYATMISQDYIFTKDKANQGRIMVGGVQVDFSTYWGSEYHLFTTPYRNEVSITYQMMTVRSFALGVDIFCRLAADGLAKWQHEIYDAIINAYVQQKADYDEKIAAEQIQQGIQVLGRNPLENRRLERDELKKLVIMMLIGSPVLNLNSFYAYSEPYMDLIKACANGAFIRFFENAFEWNNLLYVFYPYFWGRKARWISALHLTDPDPDFAAFLKAGAARVQVPVRPGFERAVAHYCQYGEIWEGHDIPLREDDLYVPIVDEITESLGKLDDGVPYPEDSQPWEVTVPTSLVVVQNLEEIPAIRDILTGNDIDLLNANA